MNAVTNLERHTRRGRSCWRCRGPGQGRGWPAACRWTCPSSGGAARDACTHTRLSPPSLTEPVAITTCLSIHCRGSGSAWIRIILVTGTASASNKNSDPDPHPDPHQIKIRIRIPIRIRIKVISWIRILINLRRQAKLYGIWAFLSTFSRFWAFL